MWPESGERQTRLRSGLSTGCCATACSLAAAQFLLKGTQTNSVMVTLPGGKTVCLVLENYEELSDLRGKGVRTVTIKDAGDDPDITHGASVFVDLYLRPEPGVIFSAAEGVGTVTRAGLPLAVGEPAINPVPRKMIVEHLSVIARDSSYQGGFAVAVGVEQGEQLALKTMNGRLGIVGGLSILGTTGIVRPFSCSAYIASIHQGIDVAKANGVEHIAATTGSTSEKFTTAHYGLSDMALIEMGDFVGAVLKYLKKVPLPRLTIAGGFGKISKLAAGHLDLHSKKSAIDFNFLASLAVSLGADQILAAKIRGANTSIEALEFCQRENIPLAKRVCEHALEKAQSIVPQSCKIDVLAIDRQGSLVGQAA